MNPRIPALLIALAAVPAHAQLAPSASKPPMAAAKPASPAAKAPRPSAQGPEPASPERLFADWDVDKNRQLSFAEFSTGLEKARLGDLLARLGQQFRQADANGNKTLDAGEYANLPIIKRGGPAAPPFATFDANKDQKLDAKEYLALVQAFLRMKGAQ